MHILYAPCGPNSAEGIFIQMTRSGEVHGKRKQEKKKNSKGIQGADLMLWARTEWTWLNLYNVANLQPVSNTVVPKGKRRTLWRPLGTDKEQKARWKTLWSPPRTVNDRQWNRGGYVVPGQRQRTKGNKNEMEDAMKSREKRTKDRKGGQSCFEVSRVQKRDRTWDRARLRKIKVTWMAVWSLQKTKKEPKVYDSMMFLENGKRTENETGCYDVLREQRKNRKWDRGRYDVPRTDKGQKVRRMTLRCSSITDKGQEVRRRTL